ncbi:hypothetical protein HY486_00840, partial [Candidatus Woesearchaeota archaeon]|nr:hypothetical protein [Candidatus Woesearchaeota archaeon]
LLILPIAQAMGNGILSTGDPTITDIRDSYDTYEPTQEKRNPLKITPSPVTIEKSTQDIPPQFVTGKEAPKTTTTPETITIQNPQTPPPETQVKVYQTAAATAEARITTFQNQLEDIQIQISANNKDKELLKQQEQLIQQINQETARAANLRQQATDLQTKIDKNTAPYMSPEDVASQERSTEATKLAQNQIPTENIDDNRPRDWYATQEDDTTFIAGTTQTPTKEQQSAGFSITGQPRLGDEYYDDLISVNYDGYDYTATGDGTYYLFGDSSGTPYVIDNGEMIEMAPNEFPPMIKQEKTLEPDITHDITQTFDTPQQTPQTQEEIIPKDIDIHTGEYYDTDYNPNDFISTPDPLKPPPPGMAASENLPQADTSEDTQATPPSPQPTGTGMSGGGGLRGPVKVVSSESTEVEYNGIKYKSIGEGKFIALEGENYGKTYTRDSQGRIIPYETSTTSSATPPEPGMAASGMIPPQPATSEPEKTRTYAQIETDIARQEKEAAQIKADMLSSQIEYYKKNVEQEDPYLQDLQYDYSIAVKELGAATERLAELEKTTQSTKHSTGMTGATPPSTPKIPPAAELPFDKLATATPLQPIKTQEFLSNLNTLDLNKMTNAETINKAPSTRIQELLKKRNTLLAEKSSPKTNSLLDAVNTAKLAENEKQILEEKQKLAEQITQEATQNHQKAYADLESITAQIDALDFELNRKDITLNPATRESYTNAKEQLETERLLITEYALVATSEQEQANTQLTHVKNSVGKQQNQITQANIALTTAIDEANTLLTTKIRAVTTAEEGVGSAEQQKKAREMTEEELGGSSEKNKITELRNADTSLKEEVTKLLTATGLNTQDKETTDALVQEVINEIKRNPTAKISNYDGKLALQISQDRSIFVQDNKIANIIQTDEEMIVVTEENGQQVFRKIAANTIISAPLSGEALFAAQEAIIQKGQKATGVWVERTLGQELGALKKQGDKEFGKFGGRGLQAGKFLRTFESYRGIGQIGTLFFSDKKMTDWRNHMADKFCAFAGIQACFKSELCDMPNDAIEGKDILATTTPQGEARSIAHLSASRGQPFIEPQEDGTGIVKTLYKVEYGVTNGLSNELSFNVYFYPTNEEADQIPVPWYPLDTKLNTGEGAQAIATGALKKFSARNYEKVCLVFSTGIRKQDGEEVNQLCTTITKYTGPAQTLQTEETELTPGATTGTETTAEQSFTPGELV